MLRLAVITVLLLVAVAGPAKGAQHGTGEMRLASAGVPRGLPLATVLKAPAGPPRALYQRWVNDSLMPTPPMIVPLRLKNCSERTLACMEWVGDRSRRTPEGTSVRLFFPDLSYLAGPAYAPSELAAIRVLFLHELGHVLDWYHRWVRGSRAHRRAFMRIMGYRRDWIVGYAPPAEYFGDAYADCASTPELSDTADYQDRYGYGYHPTPTQRRRVCALIQRLRG